MYFVQLHFESVSLFCTYKRAAASENQLSAYAKPKEQISYAVTAQLISTRSLFSLLGYYNESKLSSFHPVSVAVQSGLCQTWSETAII